MQKVSIPDAKIIHIWTDEDQSIEVGVSPDWYQENGTPVDDLGRDMLYARTEIVVDDEVKKLICR